MNNTTRLTYKSLLQNAINDTLANVDAGETDIYLAIDDAAQSNAPVYYNELLELIENKELPTTFDDIELVRYTDDVMEIIANRLTEQLHSDLIDLNDRGELNTNTIDVDNSELVTVQRSSLTYKKLFNDIVQKIDDDINNGYDYHDVIREHIERSLPDNLHDIIAVFSCRDVNNVFSDASLIEETDDIIDIIKLRIYEQLELDLINYYSNLEG